MLAEGQYYSNMAAGYYRWIRSGADPHPHTTVQHMVRNRERNFIQLMRSAVFERPSNPYHSLFQWAGCGLSDLESLVERSGLESALAALFRAGVYLSHDEFKGKIPVVRGSNSLNVDTAALGNPMYRGMIDHDLSLVRRIAMKWLGEAGSLDLRFEFFNAFNHVNFALPAPERLEVFGGPNRSTREDFGRITSAAESREIQFGAKFRF